MFGIGMQEVMLIVAIALVVIGPKKLPEVARALGKGYAEFRRAFDEMKRNVESEIHADELRKNLLDSAPRTTVTPAPSPYAAVMDASPPPPARQVPPPPAESVAEGSEETGGRG